MAVLLIEDDHTLSQNISEALKGEDIHVEVVYDGLWAERLLKKTFMIASSWISIYRQKNGYYICKDFRLYNASTPVIMVTAFSALEDKVQGFDWGAGD